MDSGQLLHVLVGGQVALIGDDVILMVQGQPSGGKPLPLGFPLMK